jgi:hypothetical protein
MYNTSMTNDNANDETKAKKMSDWKTRYADLKAAKAAKMPEAEKTPNRRPLTNEMRDQLHRGEVFQDKIDIYRNEI